MKKRMVCLLLCIVFFLTGGISGYFLRGVWLQPYLFYNFEDMNKAGMGIHFRDPEVPLPLEARWVAGVQFHQQEKEVTVYIRSGSGVPVTSEFVLSRVQYTDGYRIRAVCESFYTYQEAYRQIAALDAFFEAYAPDEIRGQEPWLGTVRLHTRGERRFGGLRQPGLPRDVRRRRRRCVGRFYRAVRNLGA